MWSGRKWEIDVNKFSDRRRIADKDQRTLIDHDRDNNLIGEFAPYIPGLLNWVLEMNGDEATQIIKDPLNHAPGLLKSKLENLIDTNSIAAWLNEKVTYIDSQIFLFTIRFM